MLFKRKGKQAAKPATAKPKRRVAPRKAAKPAPSPHGSKAAKARKVPRPQPRAATA